MFLVGAAPPLTTGRLLLVRSPDGTRMIRVSGLIEELKAANLVIYGESNRDYRLNPGVEWHFPDDGESS